MKETTEQKAIYVDNPALQKEVSIRKELIKTVNQISARLAGIGIFLTPEILSEFSADFNIISRLLLKGLQEQDPKQYELLGSVYAESVQRKVNSLNLSPLRIQLNRVISEAGISPGQVTMKNGKAELTVKEHAEITDKHTVYLSKDDQPLYDKVQTFVKSYNELQDLIRDIEPRADLGNILRSGLNDFTVNGKGEILSGNLIVSRFHEEDGRTEVMVNPLFFSHNLNLQP